MSLSSATASAASLSGCGGGVGGPISVRLLQNRLSLTRREARYLPTGFCYYNYPHEHGKAFCIADSNGNAAGNTLEEAILQGFLELVERYDLGWRDER